MDALIVHTGLQALLYDGEVGPPNCSLPPPTTRITGRGREAAPTMNRGLLSAEEGADRNNSSTATVIIIHGLNGESLFYIFS